MIDISVYDASGSFLAKSKAQIALQYAYGNSTRKSSQLRKIRFQICFMEYRLME